MIYTAIARPTAGGWHAAIYRSAGLVTLSRLHRTIRNPNHPTGYWPTQQEALNAANAHITTLGDTQ